MAQKLKLKKKRISQNFEKEDLYNSSVDTMQDDLADLISKKNRPKLKRRVGQRKGIKYVDKEEIETEDDKMIQRNLTEVYTNSDGDIPDLTKLDKSQRPVWKTVLYTLIGVLAVLLILAIVGFFIFNNIKTDGFTNEHIKLKIDTPITIISGEEAEYTITITNNEKINLYNAKLELSYPDDFEYISSEPIATSEDKNVWDFSVLKIGETKTIKLKGKVLGAVNSSLTFKGVLNFKPADNNAFYKQEAIIDVKISSSILALEIIGPDKILANQEAEYEIIYKNKSEEDLVDLQLVVDYPDGFIFETAEPSPEVENENTWLIKELLAGAEGKIVVKGDYSAISDNDTKDFTARIQIKKGDDYYPQSEEILVTKVIKDQLSLQLVINGSAEDQAVGFDDLLVYSLNYKNSGQENLEDVNIVAHLDSDILDWATLDDENNGKIEDDTITWDGKNIAKLLKLGPEEEGVIVWKIRVKDSSVIDDDTVSKFGIESYVEAISKQSGELTGESNVKSSVINNSVSSDLNLEASARYYNEGNVALGVGPIHPTVDETSVYNIKIDLTNNLNDVEDLKIVATLPDNIDWSDKKSHDAGDLIYNSGSNKVTWQISRLIKSSDTTGASFNIGITPTKDDEGKILILISDIQLTAKDSNTGARIEKSLKAVTTAFDDPIVGKINGIVKGN